MNKKIWEHFTLNTILIFIIFVLVVLIFLIIYNFDVALFLKSNIQALLSLLTIAILINNKVESAKRDLENKKLLEGYSTKLKNAVSDGNKEVIRLSKYNLKLEKRIKKNEEDILQLQAENKVVKELLKK